VFDPAGNQTELPSDLLEILFPETRLDGAGSRTVRDTIRMRVPLGELERVLTGAGGAVNLGAMRFAAAASYSNELGDDPVVDVFPNSLFVPTGAGDRNRRRR
jgi:hypothetical protein